MNPTPPAIKTHATIQDSPLEHREVLSLQKHWQAANYLSVGQIYLRDNPLLERPLRLSDVKPRLLGHWGTTPGLTFIYTHLNRLILKHDLNMIYVIGPGHGGPAIFAQTWLEGSYSERYPEIEMNREGIKRLFTQFSWPGGVPSHVAPEAPGSIHEGGELGYSLLHAFGAVFDNPDLIACCIVGDGEAETGPLATSWHSNKFLNPRRDGAVLPILHLNGYKIAGPTVLARLERAELSKLLEGYGYEVLHVEGEEPEAMHQHLSATLEYANERIQSIWSDARGRLQKGNIKRPHWPLIVFRTPKGWTGPAAVDGFPTENSFRSHQVPLSQLAEKSGHLEILEQWLKSYKPEELFDQSGAPTDELRQLCPQGARRMGMNPHANGGCLLQELNLPSPEDFKITLDQPGIVEAEATRQLGSYLREVFRLNEDNNNFRIMCPDELKSNRLGAVLEVTDRVSVSEIYPSDESVSNDGRVMEILSEHCCQGWLEGYLLTGRHGLFPCYEAFIHIVSSMFNQHAKWLKVTREIPWRAPIASLNYLLSSHVWRQDHNGFSHQDPGFIDHVVNKKPSVVRVYLPPDANTLLHVAHHCLQSRNYVNVIVAGKQPALQWFTFEEARAHCQAGIGKISWASNDEGGEPDVVLACAGDVATLEIIAAASELRRLLPDIRIRVVNIVDLMTLQSHQEHPHGLDDAEFDALFTKDKPVIFAYHGYPWLIHRLSYKRKNHHNMHVRGYKEEGTTTTPFDMVVLNEMDRYKLALDAIERIARIKSSSDAAVSELQDKRREHCRYITAHGEDMPEVRNWRWPHS